MGWLLVEKVLPTLRGGDRPDFDAVLPAAAEPPQPVCWEIQFHGTSIGHAWSLSTRNHDGSGRMESEVNFQRLPLGEIVSELLGTLGALVKPLWNAGDQLEIEMTIASEMDIGHDGNLRSLVTNVKLAEIENVIQVRGDVRGNKLQVAVYTPADDGESDSMRVRYRDEIDLPREGLVTGALSPQSRLADLHVGQTWTLPVYRPFPPNSPVQMMQAKVARHELFVWNGQSLRAFQVEFRDDVGSGISIAREPVGKLWVRDDGAVLQQEARIANLQFRFVRLADADCAQPAGKQRRETP